MGPPLSIQSHISSIEERVAHPAKCFQASDLYDILPAIVDTKLLAVHQLELELSWHR